MVVSNTPQKGCYHRHSTCIQSEGMPFVHTASTIDFSCSGLVFTTDRFHNNVLFFPLKVFIKVFQQIILRLAIRNFWALSFLADENGRGRRQGLLCPQQFFFRWSLADTILHVIPLDVKALTFRSNPYLLDLDSYMLIKPTPVRDVCASYFKDTNVRNAFYRIFRWRRYLRL